MKLHDPNTEKELIHIATRVVGSAGFLKTGFADWGRSIRKALIYMGVAYVVALVFAFLKNMGDLPQLRHALCAALLMALVRLGLGRIATSFQSACFFGTLANLPIHGKRALTHIRIIFILRFWFVSLIGSFFAALCLHFPIDPVNYLTLLATWALLFGIVWATLSITQLGLIRHLYLAIIWRLAAYLLFAQIVLLILFEDRSFIPPAGLAALDELISYILWIFPPAWAFPEMLAKGGMIPAILWIAWGLWCWIRWPSTAFPAYDRPHDLLGAFGDVGISDEIDEAENPLVSEENSSALEPPPQPPSTGWVERLIAATLPASDRVVAGAFLSESRHGRRVTAIIIFAAFWLLALSIGKNLYHRELLWLLLVILSWIVPAVLFLLILLPHGNPMKAALQPCPVGNSPVPFFTMFPVTIRSLLRIIFRIVIVRTAIAVAIAIPIFWLLAKILSFTQAGLISITLTSTIALAWILSVPAFLANQMDPHLRRRKGIFPLILATSLVQVPIGFLWIIGSLAGVGFSIAWSIENSTGRYGFLLLAIGCFALSAVMSWLIFEILHLSLRQRRYEWKSKMR